MPYQSPTWSLKSHVWLSSSGNNCHAVYRSLSSGASVHECTMGIFFTSSHFISQFPPTRFPLITAIRMCHLPPVHHLGMAFLAWLKVKIQQIIQYQKHPCRKTIVELFNISTITPWFVKVLRFFIYCREHWSDFAEFVFSTIVFFLCQVLTCL